ncbi:MAG: hypothetical protein HC860_21975 [Alkalinema sp. RU_4_3]|nr:hypothetical protein [Alkalinema sp. RU_4_3]
MTERCKFQVTIGFSDTALSDEERDTAAVRLMEQLRDLDEIEAVGRVSEVAPDGSKSGLGFLTGFLMAEVNKENG